MNVGEIKQDQAIREEDLSFLHFKSFNLSLDPTLLLLRERNFLPLNRCWVQLNV